jgi:TonB family protein
MAPMMGGRCRAPNQFVMAQTNKNPFWNYAPEGPTAGNSERNFRVVPRPGEQLFKPLEFAESRQRAVFTSIVVHAVLLSILLLIPLYFFDPLNVKRYYAVTLVPPMPQKQVLEVTHWKPIALPRPKPPEKVVAPPPRKPEVQQVELKKPELLPKPPKPEEVKIPSIKVDPKPVLVAESKREDPRPEPPKPVVKTNVFGGSTGSSAKPTVDLPAKQVQTGGFGDPNGIKGEGKADKPGNILSLGSFDLPVGPGAGNGTGGDKGVRGVVASAGFGNGVATDTPGAGGLGGGARTARATVQKGSFGDVDATPAAAQPKKREAEAAQTPVEITFKPRPDYTKEARAMKIEGEVLVRVQFTASGQVKVLGIARGLGHGLDESALRAAEQIRFKPAMRAGSPVDSTATVHIVFQLAN